MAKKKVAGEKDPHSAKKQGKRIDPVHVFAEKLRDHKELESRWAVLQETRVEYFRGKDFISLLKSHPELKKSMGEEQTAQDPEDIGNLLLRRKLILRLDRVMKTVRPGKKKLSKWPAHLELFPEQTFSEDDAFFAWTFERRRPLWQIVLSFLVPIITLACCLFPVFPHWCKLIVLYFCLGVLLLIFGILIVRWIIFGLLWIVLGKRIWFFPNVLAEEATFKELVQFWPDSSKDEKPPKWTARLAFAVVTGLVIWFCVHHAPDEAARARYQKKVSNIIDEVLEWSPKLALSGKVQGNVTVSNATFENESHEKTNETFSTPAKAVDEPLQDELTNSSQASGLDTEES
ncbi:hypothetical protein O6H91_02G083000 [Diphasiastrum complanatum]|uniref:Uncharacterized protein n=1 Tax=Diphasiastrum complanatum TaxID=34168 RepID=A0ACC2EHY0_DIPCM|nr:hypothetical protein O6H91_02G083000 [Diphasiastrum complanatum]